MEVLILLIFVSSVLVTGAVAFFAWNVRQGTHEHADRLALLPLEEADPNRGTRPAKGAPRDGGGTRAAPVPETPEASR
ncbi:MAG: cbb3-type cytochrome oxidase assembly protein CcoS [Myxococcota bacterium]